MVTADVTETSSTMNEYTQPENPETNHFISDGRESLHQYQSLMCTIVMPADYEMLASYSPPPMFNHSKPTGCLSDCSSLRFGPSPFTRIHPRVPNRSCSTLSIVKPPPIMPASPKRPCLVIRAEDHSSSSGEDDPTSPTRLKKKVVFADDKGMSLTHVRVMSEPSNVPPFWTTKFLAQVTQGVTADPLAQDEPWEITFQQPASNYINFRRKLDMGKVSLENVIVKEAEDCIIGTVKVSNLAFHKEVFIRSTSDGWKTHEDTFCKYVSYSASNSVNAAYVLYDTFSFKLTLPIKFKKIEFCVCFRCEGQEYWDNNDGANYIIKKDVHPLMQKSYSSDDMLKSNIAQKKREAESEINLKAKCSDAMQAKMESWSEFASWTHLENSNPYW